MIAKAGNDIFWKARFDEMPEVANAEWRRTALLKRRPGRPRQIAGGRWFAVGDAAGDMGAATVWMMNDAFAPIVKVFLKAQRNKLAWNGRLAVVELSGVKHMLP